MAKNFPISPCRIGTRRSELAITQTEWVAQKLRTQGVECVLREISSEGDFDTQTPLYAMETSSPGVFCKILENALLAGEIDLAVHSLKDLPTQQPPGLSVLAFPSRESARDVLLIHPGAFDDKAQGLPLITGAHVGTSSLRREAQLTHRRPDLRISPLRGNILSRLEKLRSRQWDAVVLAEAGIRRLGLGLEGLRSQVLDEREFAAAPGQGALAIEAATTLPRLWKDAVVALNDPATEMETRFERRVLRALEGGCTLPLGIRCWVRENGEWEVVAFLGETPHGTSPQSGPRRWLGFHSFASRAESSEVLFQQTFEYFRRWVQK